MTPWIRALLTLSFWLCACAQAQVTCSTVTASSVTGAYTAAAATGLTGNITLTCTRSSGGKTPTIWIGMNNGVNGTRNLKSGSDLVAYGLFRNADFSGSWTATAAATGAAAGGVGVTFDFNILNTVTQNLNYYLQIPAGLWEAAGSYGDTVTMTVRLTNNTGTVLGSTTFAPLVTVNDYCTFTAPPGSVNINYTSFGSQASGTTTFSVQCNNRRTYSVALTPPAPPANTSLLGVAYSMALSASGGTGNGLAQSYTVTGTVAAGQPGTCAVGSGCTASATWTLTITY